MERWVSAPDLPGQGPFASGQVEILWFCEVAGNFGSSVEVKNFLLRMLQLQNLQSCLVVSEKQLCILLEIRWGQFGLVLGLCSI